MRELLKLLYCEFAKLRRKPLFFISSALSALPPLAYALFLSDAATSAEAVEKMMAAAQQMSAYLLLMPLLVILASHLLFLETDNDTRKNLLTIPVSASALAAAKLLLLLLFSVLFMAVGGLLCLIILLLQGFAPVGFLKLFGVGLLESVLMWTGALPCILLVTALNKSYIISVIITFFYTISNYLIAQTDFFLTQPFGLNPGTLLPGPLTFRWLYPFYSQSDPSAELAALLERLSPYFLTTAQAFLVALPEAVLCCTLIAAVYRRQKS